MLLLERNELASAASSRAAGLVLQVSSKGAKTPLARLTVETFPHLEDELGDSVGFHPVGSLRIVGDAVRKAELEAMTADAPSAGIGVEWPDRRDLARMVPWLDTENVTSAAFVPSDGYIDPYLLTMSYVRAAQARGADVRPRKGVRDIIVERGTATGVITDTGRVSSGTVIDACGVWAALLSQRVGFALPFAPVRSHYWIIEPSALTAGEHPVTVLPDAAAYTRPEVGGLVLGVQEPNCAAFDARDLPEDPAAFSATHGEEHWDILAAAYDDLVRFYPGVKEAAFSGYISGLSSYTPDGHIILGPVPGVSGFFAAAGDCGSGVTLSAGMGDAIADLAMGHASQFDLSAFRPDRFGEVDPYSAEFRERCAAARASKTAVTTLRAGGHPG